jgi:3-oxoacyl-(acyl-carrier-protein) synthase
VVVATAIGGFGQAEQFYAGHQKSLPHGTLYFDDLATTIAAQLCPDATTVTISTGCTSSIDAIGYAFWMIRSGRWRRVLVVGADAPLTPTTLAAFDVLGAITNSHNERPQVASRPFSLDRDGFVLAEGAGALLIEDSEHALERGTSQFAEIIGFGSVNSGHHMTDLEPDGRAISRAIIAAAADTGESGRALEQVDYINAHGSGTRQNDRAESAALRSVFGARLADIPVNSTKAYVGHCLGAAGMLEAVHVILSISNCTVTPAVTALIPDPDIEESCIWRAVAQATPHLRPSPALQIQSR